MKLEIGGLDYDKQTFFVKLLLLIVFPIISILIYAIVIVIVLPCLVLGWIMMFIKLFKRRTK